MDRKDKLAYCRDTKIPELQQENRFLRAQIESLSNAELQIAQCDEQLAAGRAEAERAVAVEEELAKAKRLKAEEQSRVEVLEARVQQLESGRGKAEAELKSAKALVFARCKGIVVVLESEVNLELMQLKHQHQVLG